jgi:hypothetical protein
MQRFVPGLLAAVLSWPALAAEPAAAADKPTPAPAAAASADELHPLVQITGPQKARLARKLRKMADKPFDAPDQALAYYANKRTGPVIFRGDNLTYNRSIDPQWYLPAIEQMRAMPVLGAASDGAGPSSKRATIRAAVAPGSALNGWTNLGPANQGGRTRALLIDPVSPNVMYAGGVAGGVWKSTDAGASWATSTDLTMSNLAVVTLAFQPGNPQILYAGTGEGVGNADAVRGAGVFKSTDGGINWTQLPSTANANFYYSMKVVVSPRNVNRLFVATRTGLWRSVDGGSNWTNVVTSASNGCTDMAIQEKRAIGYVFVSCGRTSGQGTIWRVLDSDTGTATSVMSLAGQGRSSIAVAPSNESVIYVAASQRSAGGGAGQYGLHGIYRSTANGNPGSFTTQRSGTTPFSGTADKINKLLLSNPVIALLSECGFGTSSLLNQGWYDNVIAVDPVDSNRVWVGGVDLWRSDNGGVDWGTAGYWWFTKGVDGEYHHADQHGLVFHPGYNGTTNKVLFSAHDGGVDRNDDARAPVNTTLAQLCGAPVASGATWVDRNAGYVTTQFYNGTAYPNGSAYFGGLQDNGTQRGQSASLAWTTLAGGDGGYVAIDTQGDNNGANDVLFLENTGLSLQRSTNGGATFSSATTGITGTGFQFITPFAMNQGNKQQLWIGGFDIWRTTNQAASWTRATGVNGTCGLGAVSAIATHPLDGNRVLVGMSDGCYHYNTSALTAPASGNWPGGSTIAAGNISSMAWDPSNINVAYATVSNFTTNTVLKSTDGGVTWAPIMGSGITALPTIPAHSVVVNPADTNQIFVGTDLGVFTSIDAGATWYRENTGFANVVVEWLAINETPPYKLFAFTHGRGAWVTDLATSTAAAAAARKVNASTMR